MDKRELFKTIAALLERWLEYQAYHHELPGLSVGIVLGEETVFLKHVGYANLDTLQAVGGQTMFRIASHSKLFTATAVMRLKAAGKLNLDDPVAKHLPWFHSDNDPDLDKISLRHLLTHGSGIVRDGDTLHWTYDEPFPSRESLIRQVQAGISIYPSGEHWKYSNFGYGILGQVIESLSGKPYSEAVLDLVVKPLGLKNTRPEINNLPDGHLAVGYGLRYPGEHRQPFDHLQAGAFDGAAGFCSTVEDLLAFYQAHRMGNDNLLDDHDKREMQRVQFKEGGYEWGLGFALREIGHIPYVGHGGRYPGFITFSGLNQHHHLIIAVLTNAVDGPARDLFAGISHLMHLLLDRAELFTSEENPAKRSMREVAGIYRSIWGDYLFGRIGDALVGFNPALSDPAAEMDVLEPLGPLRFRIPVRDQVGSIGEQIVFLRNEQGKVDKMIAPGRSANRVDIGPPSPK